VDGFGHALRLIPVYRFGASGGNRTETAAAGADIAKDHKGGSAFAPTFAHIRAVAAFADRMELMSIYETADMLIIFADRKFDS
jgi:hypothetical protein